VLTDEAAGGGDFVTADVPAGTTPSTPVDGAPSLPTTVVFGSMLASRLAQELQAKAASTVERAKSAFIMR
jgi:hypothetical protein